MENEENKYVYLFHEGNSQMREILGGKGANLAEMTNLGLPIPQGFTITTTSCNRYYENGETIPEEVKNQIMEALSQLEEIAGRRLGDSQKPLLVSVRSGARASMPGMMDTILNLGLNDETVLTYASKNERFAYDSYRRLIQMYADVVKEVPRELFEDAISLKKQQRCLNLDTDMDANDLKDLVKVFKEIYHTHTGEDFPQDPRVQLMNSIEAVFKSWNNPRAIKYRRLNDIPGDWGTAVNVQQMVFGNMGEDCGTGVAFSRNPVTGENKLFGEFLMNAQGEDVVAGVRTPAPIETLAQNNPAVYEDFYRYAKRLEEHYKDMQDLEFTIEHGKLYILQTRNGKRTANAALKIAVDLVEEGMISQKEAVLRVEAKQLDQLLHPNFNPEKLKNGKIIAKGLPASPGAAAGKIVFSAERAVELKEQGEKDLILVRLETSPEDIDGMNVCRGILTLRGGMTSHAAVVARGMGRCCVSGCSELSIKEEEKTFTVIADGTTYREGDYISLDGSTGNVYGEKIETVDATISGNFAKLMAWADNYRVLKIRTNADTPRDAKQAYEFGAEGIGLCRTEHMFFAADRIAAIREMIVSKTKEQRKKALAKILPMQKEDFKGLYKAMNGYPVTIRLLDPPLHEFLPKEENEMIDLAQNMGMSVEELKDIITGLHEFNPMMGHRGCRLDVTYPEIGEMQTRAIIEAAIEVNQEGMNIVPEIMVPLVGEEKEMKYVKDIITSTAEKVIAEKGVKLDYHIGTMIEIPRAALLADEIAKEAEFFSFGTNDLTQLTFGFSRDDAGKFLNDYYDKKIYEFDPFAKMDQDGVGKLVKISVELGRRTRPDIKLGICGEHGGDPASIEFCHKVRTNLCFLFPFPCTYCKISSSTSSN